MYQWEKVDEAVRQIEKRSDIRPEAVIVLGSGLGRVAESLECADIIPYEEIPYWPRSTAPGHEGRLLFGSLHGRKVAVMQGRVHYYEGYTMQEVVFPVRVLGQLGAKTFIATNASGIVNKEITPGELIAIEDHINFMGVNPLTGANNDDWGTRFPDMSEAYDRKFLEILDKAAKKEGIPLRRGIYIAFQGPSFETPAEVRMARVLGADIVGMSTVPEVIAANHMGMRVLGLSCAANYGSGLSPHKLSHIEVLEAMSKAGESMSRLLEAFVEEADI